MHELVFFVLLQQMDLLMVVTMTGVVAAVMSPAFLPQTLDLTMAPLGALSAPGMLTQS